MVPIKVLAPVGENALLGEGRKRKDKEKEVNVLHPKSQSHFQVPRVQHDSVSLLAFAAKNVFWIQFGSRSEMWRPAPESLSLFLGDDETTKMDLLLSKWDYGNDPQCPFVHF